MDFHTFMESQIPGYDVLLEEKTVKSLQSLYQTALQFENAANYCFEMQFQTKAGIDYSTDYDKNRTLAAEYRFRLDNEICKLKEQLGISTKDEKVNPTK